MKMQTAKCLAVRPLAWGLLAAVLFLPLYAPAQTAASVESKLQAIILPSIDLNHAPIELVVQLLNARGAELDPAKQGVPIVLKLKGKPVDQIPQVTFHGKQISLLDSIKAVTLSAGLAYRIDGNFVVIEPE